MRQQNLNKHTLVTHTSTQRIEIKRFWIELQTEHGYMLNVKIVSFSCLILRMYTSKCTRFKTQILCLLFRSPRLLFHLALVYFDSSCLFFPYVRIIVILDMALNWIQMFAARLQQHRLIFQTENESHFHAKAHSLACSKTISETVFFFFTFSFSTRWQNLLEYNTFTHTHTHTKYRSNVKRICWEI